jgi:predicted N-acetyltransferase YhbS
MDDEITVRPARDWEEVRRSVVGAGRAFSGRKPEGEFFAERVLRAPALPLDNTLLLLHDGELVSSLQLYERQLSLAGRRVWAAALGNVYTLPESRGEGYGTRLLRECCDVIEEKGYGVSVLLSGRHGFYGSVDWEVLPYSRLRCSDPERLPDPESEERAGSWETFETDRHLERVRELYRHEERRTEGRVARPRSLWTDWILADGTELFSEEDVLVYREGDAVEGYLVHEHTGDAGTVACRELVYSGDGDGNGRTVRTVAWNATVRTVGSSGTHLPAGCPMPSRRVDCQSSPSSGVTAWCSCTTRSSSRRSPARRSRRRRTSAST